MVTWRVLSDDENKLLFKLKEGEDLFFFVTDLTKIWNSTLSKTAFIKLLNDSNKLLYGFDSGQILEMALDILKNDNLQSTKPHVEVNSSQNTLTFRIRSRKDNCPVTIKMELQLGNAEMFFRNVTMALLESIQDLKMSQDKLIETISKKDREIEDYKLEGAKLGLKYLKTPIFDIAGHSMKHSTLLQSFESITVFESAISDYKEKEMSATISKLDNDVDDKMKSDQGTNVKSSCNIKLESKIVKSEPKPSVQIKAEINSRPAVQTKNKAKKRGLNF